MVGRGCAFASALLLLLSVETYASVQTFEYSIDAEFIIPGSVYIQDSISADITLQTIMPNDGRLRPITASVVDVDFVFNGRNYQATDFGLYSGEATAYGGFAASFDSSVGGIGLVFLNPNNSGFEAPSLYYVTGSGGGAFAGGGWSLDKWTVQGDAYVTFRPEDIGTNEESGADYLAFDDPDGPAHFIDPVVADISGDLNVYVTADYPPFPNAYMSFRLTVKNFSDFIVGETMFVGTPLGDSRPGIGQVTVDGNLTANSIEVTYGSLDGTGEVTGDIIIGGNLLPDNSYAWANVSGTLDINGDVTVKQGGTLSGNTSIIGNLIVDGGQVLPGTSPGVISVGGDFLMTDGTLVIEILGANPNQFDRLDITGTASFGPDANILIKFMNGFVPGAGDVFAFLTASAFSDMQAAISIEGAPDGFVVELFGGALSLKAQSTIVPEPRTWALYIAAFWALALAVRSRQRRTLGQIRI